MKEKEKPQITLGKARGRAATEIAFAIQDSHKKGRNLRTGEDKVSAEQVMLEVMTELVSRK